MHSTSLVVRAAVLGLVVSMSLTAAAHAQNRFGLTARAGADFGGDKLVQFQYSDGTTPTIVAGNGLELSAGAVAQLWEAAGQSVDAQLNIGWKYSTIPPASNQTASWNRFPVEALLRYGSPMGLKFGGGLVAHVGNVLQASGSAVNTRLSFKTTPGFVLHAEYAFARWSLDARYTALKYTIQSGGSGTVNANSFGAGLDYRVW